MNPDSSIVISTVAGVFVFFSGMWIGGLIERHNFFGTFKPNVKYGSMDKNGNRVKRSVSRLGGE